MQRVSQFLSEYKTDLIILAVAVIAWLLLSSRPTPINEVESLVGQEQTTVLYFYSNRCPQCLVAKPIIESIERDIVADEGRFVKVNVFDEVGRAATRHFGVVVTPTLIVINECDELVVFHQGIPRHADIVSSAAQTCQTAAR